MTEQLLNYFNGDELAAPVWQRKYALPGEVTPDDMHKRLAKPFARIEYKYQTKENNQIEDELSDFGRYLLANPLNEEQIYTLFKDFKYVVPQGSIMSQLGADSIGSLSNCFVVGQPYDSYGGIMQKDQELVQLMKRRGGVGIDISTLRPSGVTTTNAAKSSTGAVSFMERFSNSTREVAQNGRRGALMLSISVNHPDVAEFVTIKNDETKVTGANISVFLTDEFMQAVEKDEDYWMTYPCDIDLDKSKLKSERYEYNVLNEFTLKEDGSKFYTKKVKAKELYNKIVNSAWLRAEPGQLFIDRFHNYSPDGVYPQYRGVTTNPCSEIFMQPYDACRLMAVNLFSFVENPFTKDARFDFDKFFRYNYITQRLMDDLVDLELEHIDQILKKINSDPEPEEVKATERNLWEKIREVASAGRRTGTGITALGDTLAALGLKYDSAEGIVMIKTIMSVKMESELDCTTDLAILRGSFKGWDSKKEFNVEGESVKGNNEFYNFIAETYPEQAQRMVKYGRRNISWSTIAPTGTVSLMTQTTSGLEPLFMPYYTRRVKVNPSDPTMRVDFVDKVGDKWMEQPVLHPKFKQWIEVTYKSGVTFKDSDNSLPIEVSKLTKEELESMFKQSPWYNSTAPDIDWGKRVKIQGVIQKYISHSISSTINLPNNVTEEEVAEIYIASWKEGLKGVTVYRDGCRSGVLVTESDNSEVKFEQHDAPKRPKELNAETHITMCKGTPYNVIVGLLDGKPYEVFVDNSNNKYSKEGKLIKKSRGKYIFKSNDEEIDVLTFMNDEEEAITRLTSTNLRHGASIAFVVQQLQKTSGDMFSFTKGLARVLKKYIPEGEKVSGVTCKDCGSSNVIFEEGCNKCLSCGSSACG